MKQLILLFAFLFSSICVSSQHLNFSGIPITGTISQFQSKLLAKGIKLNREKSQNAPLGQRIFKGMFHGYYSEITVFYNRNSKNVYKVEAVIESKKKEVIQKILDKSIRLIENKYIFEAKHELNDGSNLHYNYFIFPTPKGSSCIGSIKVEPSYTYYVPNDAEPFKEFQLASFIITFKYEDSLNSSLNKPSETEPYASRSLLCGKSENFDNFLRWADNYLKNECYDQCLLYLTWVLDYYKYGCAPQNASVNEKLLDNAILALKKRLIGQVKTAYSNEYTNVYRVVDNNGKFKCIEFGVNSNMYQVKLSSYDIVRHIHILEILQKMYSQKQSQLKGMKLSEYWNENINMSIPALIGEEQLKNGFGDIKWKECNLSMRFTHFKNELRIEVLADSYKDIFLFCNNQEINSYLEFLKSIKRKENF